MMLSMVGLEQDPVGRNAATSRCSGVDHADQAGVPRSQHGAGGLLDYPHYTRPAEFEGLRVPGVLLNGDHQQIRRWRREQQLRKTLENRPDLLEHADRRHEAIMVAQP